MHWGKARGPACRGPTQPHLQQHLDGAPLHNVARQRRGHHAPEGVAVGSHSPPLVTSHLLRLLRVCMRSGAANMVRREAGREAVYGRLPHSTAHPPRPSITQIPAVRRCPPACCSEARPACAGAGKPHPPGQPPPASPGHAGRVVPPRCSAAHTRRRGEPPHTSPLHLRQQGRHLPMLQRIGQLQLQQEPQLPLRLRIQHLKPRLQQHRGRGAGRHQTLTTHT